MPSGSGELKKDRVYRKIMEMISNGSVADGKFPSEPEFCKLLNVSRVTLRSALQRLENEGIITRSQYYGTRIVQTQTKKKALKYKAFSQFLPLDLSNNIFLDLYKFRHEMNIASYYESNCPRFLDSLFLIIEFLCLLSVL